MAVSRVIVVLTIVLGLVVLLLLSLAFATNYWITYTVDRSRIGQPTRSQSERNVSLSYYHTRSRGIFKVCFPGKDAKFLSTSNKCVKTLYEPDPVIIRPTQAYWNRLHLLRCHFAFLILGLASSVLSVMLAGVMAVQQRALWAKLAGVFAYLGAFASAASIAFFHGVEYIERSVISTQHDGHMFYANWPKNLQEATDRQYDWSYILCWIGAVMAAVCATLFVIAAWLNQKENKHEESRDVLAKRFMSERNAGPIMVAEPGPYGYDEPPYGKYFYPRAYLGPYMYEMHDRGYPPYPEQIPPMWHWQ